MTMQSFMTSEGSENTSWSGASKGHMWREIFASSLKDYESKLNLKRSSICAAFPVLIWSQYGL